MSAADPVPQRPGVMAILGIALLLAAFIMSIWRIHRTNVEQYAPGTRVLRMVHWHLESGVRETLEKYIREYEQLRAADGVNVRIVQLPIAERGFMQFVRTNMIGGTLPDLVEWGRFHNPLDIQRHFVPLTAALSVANPYNAGTSLSETPWRETFFDSLRYSFVRELHDYYSVGFSTFTVRLFYNRDLLAELAGMSAAPADYESFLDACRRIEEAGRTRGIHPIASSGQALTMFEENLVPTILGDLSYRLDYSLDGSLTLQEKLHGYVAGLYSFLYDPQMRAADEVVTRLTRHFTPGFMAVQRDESVRQFIQGKAVFYASGSWDVPSLQFNTPFQLGVAAFPFPTADHPTYGPFFDGPPSEAETGTGFSFGLAKTSAHPEEAIRFLQFLTSQRVNERLNADLRWIPSIRGAAADDFLKPFLPNAEGSVNPWLFSLLGASGRVHMLRSQLFWPRVSGETTYEQYAGALEREYIQAAAADLRIQNENNRRGELQSDAKRLIFLFQELAEEDPALRERAALRFRVSTEALYHSAKDTMLNRVVFNALLRDTANPRAQSLRRAIGLAEGAEYVP